MLQASEPIKQSNNKTKEDVSHEQRMSINDIFAFVSKQEQAKWRKRLLPFENSSSVNNKSESTSDGKTFRCVPLYQYSINFLCFY